MTVTGVKLYKSKIQSVKAYGHVEFDNSMTVQVSIFPGKEHGVYVGWPGYKANDGKWKSHIMWREEKDRETVNKKILEAYGKMGEIDQTLSQPTESAAQTTTESVPF